MIITVDCPTPSIASAVIVEAWKHGVEVERLNGNQIELTSGRDDKLDLVIKRFPVVILHKELTKLVTGEM